VNRPDRIGIVCAAGIVSGKELMALSLAKALRDAGCAVTMLASSWNNGDFPDRLRNAAIPARILPLGFISATLTWKNIGMTAEQVSRWPELLLRYRAFLRDTRPQRVIHTNWHHLLLLAPFLRRERDIYWVHDFIPSSLRYRTLFRWLDRHLAAFVVVSQSVARSLVQAGVNEASISVIHNGIEDLAQAQATPSRPAGTPFRVGIVGQVGQWKGHDDLLAAFASVRGSFKDAELHVFGSGSPGYAEHLKQSAARLNVSDAVTWHGFVSDRLSIYRKIDVCVVPSRSEDPLPTIAIESAFFGLPVIATRRGGLPEIVVHEQTGLLVDAESPDDLAAAIERLAGDPALTARLGATARDHVVERFSAPRFVSRFNELLAARGSAC